jgi:hypothetical protein
MYFRVFTQLLKYRQGSSPLDHRGLNQHRLSDWHRAEIDQADENHYSLFRLHIGNSICWN